MHPFNATAPAHDAINRLLQRLVPNTEDLWREAERYVEPTYGILVMDDTMLTNFTLSNRIGHSSVVR